VRFRARSREEKAPLPKYFVNILEDDTVHLGQSRFNRRYF
jgi:hypothetical protein